MRPSRARARMSSETLPEHVWMSRTKRNSSTYTSDSAHSVETAGTSISDILQMYKDYTKQRSQSQSSRGLSPSRRALGPTAYRETVEPLLEWRFSFDDQTRFTRAAHDDPARPPAQGEAPSNTPPMTNYLVAAATREAPSFTEFARSLQARKGILKSLISPSAVERDRYIVVNEPVPIRPSISSTRRPSRNFSRKGSFSTMSEDFSTDPKMLPDPLNLHRHNDRPSRSDQVREVAPKYVLNASRKSTPNLRIFPAPQDSSIRRLASNSAMSSSRTKSMTTSSSHHHHQIYDHDPFPVQRDNRPQTTPHTQATNADLRYTNSHRRRLQKKRSKPAMAHSHGNEEPPATANHERNFSWTENRSRSIKAGVNSMLRRLSITAQPKETVPTSVPQHIPQRPIPVHPNQDHEPLVPPSDEAKHQKLMVMEIPGKGDNATEKSRDSLDRREVSQHRRTASGKSTSSIGSVLEGLKHSLRRRSSEKRREKLKASIVFIGPTTITAEKNATYGMI